MSRASLIFPHFSLEYHVFLHILEPMNPDRLNYIADLALHPNTPQGEWEAAAVAFFRVLRNSNTPPEAILVSSEAPRKFHPERSGSTPMPFGKFKDLPLAEIPSDYLEFLLSCDWLRHPLRSRIEEELDARS
jgi:Putative quorum-sensing-regulated virulence factor